MSCTVAWVLSTCVTLESASSLIPSLLAPCKGKALLSWRHLELYHKQTSDGGSKFPPVQRSHAPRNGERRGYSRESVRIPAEPFARDSGWTMFFRSEPLPDPPRFDFFFPRALDRCPTGYGQQPISGHHWRQFSSFWHVSPSPLATLKGTARKSWRQGNRSAIKKKKSINNLIKFNLDYRKLSSLFLFRD